MRVTRRRAIAGLALAGLEAMLCPLLKGMARSAAARGEVVFYPPMDLSLFDAPLQRGAMELRVGCAAITWGGQDDQAIEQIAALGYRGIQLRANVLKTHPDAKALRDQLEEHKLTLVALSSGATPLDAAKEKETVELHAAHAKYVQAAGGKYLQIIGASARKGAGTWTAADYRRQGALLTEIGKRAAEYGVQTGFHNHMGTIGETPQATEAILAAADERYVKLELDVAHYQQGGGDPAAAVRKYGRRLLFLHLKDVTPSKAAGGYEFAELGQGRVNWPALLDALREVGFRGWGIVELDGERPGASRTPAESARMSKEYLEKMGVQV